MIIIIVIVVVTINILTYLYNDQLNKIYNTQSSLYDRISIIQLIISHNY